MYGIHGVVILFELAHVTLITIEISSKHLVNVFFFNYSSLREWIHKKIEWYLDHLSNKIRIKIIIFFIASDIIYYPPLNSLTFLSYFDFK